MKKIFTILASVSVLSSVCSSAQTFNPRVEVTNAFEGKVVEASKQVLPLNVPDSLMKFQYQIDYSVFDNPYKGSYEFQPYKITMKPDAAPSGYRSLYASIGCGYSLHPELDLVYSPRFKKYPVRLSLYDNFRGFIGDYSHLGMLQDGLILEVGKKADRPNKGFVLDNKAGADVVYEFAGMTLEFDGGYRVFATDDTLSCHFLQLAEAKVKLMPLDPNHADIFYGGSLYVNAGKDDYSALVSGRHKLGVNNMGADASFGKNVGARSAVVADLSIETVVYSGVHEASVTRFGIAPKFRTSWKSGLASLGINLSDLKGNDHPLDGSDFTAFSHASEILYPDVHVKQYIVPEHLAFYADVTGGDNVNCYTSMLRDNPFFNPKMVVPFMDSSSDRMDAVAGFQTDIAGKLHVDLSGGYAIHLNKRCDAVQILENTDYITGDVARYLTSFNQYCDYNSIHGDMSFIWKSSRVDVDGHFRYEKTDLADNGWFAVAPSEYSGRVSAAYNWNHKAYAGIIVEAASERNGYMSIGQDPDNFYMVSIPGWIDLGLYGSYRINNRWTAWLKAGNLLGQSVHRYFLHPEKGPYATVGISFSI